MCRFVDSFKLAHGIVTAMFLTACSSSAPPSLSHRAPTGSASVASAPLIDLRPLTITFRGQPIARLFADGRTESAGPNAPGKDVPLIPGPTLRADGTIVMTKGGITARLDDKGDIYVVGPPGENPREELFGRIERDQFTFAGSPRPWNVRVRGNLIEFGEENSSQIEGDVTPSMRHTAVVMAAAFYIDGVISAP